MNKDDFFSSFKPRTEVYDLPDGQSIEISELTLEQRGKLHEAAKKNPIDAQALIVCMACSLFDESDMDAVKGLAGDLVTGIASAVLAASGLADEEAEKN